MMKFFADKNNPYITVEIYEVEDTNDKRNI